jgi:hypothetical protein
MDRVRGWILAHINGNPLTPMRAMGIRSPLPGMLGYYYGDRVIAVMTDSRRLLTNDDKLTLHARAAGFDVRELDLEYFDSLTMNSSTEVRARESRFPSVAIESFDEEASPTSVEF